MSIPFSLRPKLFALITAIEKDCRDLLQSFIEIQQFPVDVRERAEERLRQEDVTCEISAYSLLQQIEFTDIAKLLHQIKKNALFDQEHRNCLEEIASHIEGKLKDVRNRVCHTKPLHSEDYPLTENFCENLLEFKNIFAFPFVKKALSGEYQPNYNPTKQKDRILHNLPFVDYEETGFIGRETELEDLKRRLCKNSSAVISIVGEGGIGKTAFALKCLYTILDDDVADYDFIIWNTFKTDRLTVKGVEKIAHTMQFIIDPIFLDEQDYPSDTSMDNILRFMEQHKVLLVLDNLETVSYEDAFLMKLVSEVPRQSKILITTRIRLQYNETPFPLSELDNKASRTIFRTYAKYLKIPNCKLNLSDVEIDKCCNQLYKNPLLIKWYLLNINSGADPINLAATSKPFAEAVEFCFGNVFSKFSLLQKEISYSLAILNKPCTLYEIIHYLNTDSQSINQEFNSLSAAGIFIIELNDNTRTYQLSAFVLDYISKHGDTREVNRIYQQITTSQKELRALRQQDLVRSNTYKYKIERVNIGNTDDISLIVRKELIQAFTLLTDASPLQALNRINELVQKYSGVAEVYRISGFIKAKNNDIFGATQDYQRALELEPDNTLILWTIAKFSAQYPTQDYELALSYIEKALVLDPTEFTLKTAKALYCSRSGNSEEAKKLYTEALLTIQEVNKIPEYYKSQIFDQAIDCYIRSSDQAVRNSNTKSFNQDIDKSIELLDEALTSGLYDNKLIENRLPQIINQIVKYKNLISLEIKDSLKYLIRKSNLLEHMSKQTKSLYTSLFVNTCAELPLGITKPPSISNRNYNTLEITSTKS
ncbi:MAG: NB-ARC domain-containing protein [Candidatus Melainabacteria bacterium]|nr:NB-ARC domain-containing protein [Candidatus Melainabacteria bacterium]